MIDLTTMKRAAMAACVLAGATLMAAKMSSSVPSGWGEAANAELRSPPVGTIPSNVTHRVVLFEDGMCGLRKFKHQVTRTTNDVVFLDGVRK